VDRLAGTDDGYVYFNNDHRACAVENARTFERMVERIASQVGSPPFAG
jgi:uncharacterized protein YecE (DUF72 family)